MSHRVKNEGSVLNAPELTLIKLLNLSELQFLCEYHEKNISPASEVPVGTKTELIK